MKARLISILAAALILLTGCGGKNGGDGAPPPDTQKEYPQADVSGTNAVFVTTTGGPIPIAYTTDGISQLAGDNYYYNLQSLLSADSKLMSKPVTYFTADGAETESDKAKPYGALATSGNWRLCPAARHSSIGQKDDASDGYKQFIYESFPDKFASVSDVKVTDIWEYDLDGDGAADAAVRAAGDGYSILCFQSTTLGNKLLAANFGQDKSYICQPFFADIDGDGKCSLISISGAGFKTATIYKQGALEPEYTVYLPLEK